MLKVIRKKASLLLALSLCGVIFIYLWSLWPWQSELSTHGAMMPPRNSDKLRAEGLRFVPKNSDIRGVKTLLERNGFACNVTDNTSAYVSNFNCQKAVQSVKRYILLCDQQRNGLFQEQWTLPIHFRGYKVQNVERIYWIKPWIEF